MVDDNTALWFWEETARPALNNLLAPDMTTREVIRLFADSNTFLRNVERQYDRVHGQLCR